MLTNVEAYRGRIVGTPAIALAALLTLAATAAAPGSRAPRVLHAGPGDYLSALKRLHPGDTLVLRSGTYGSADPVPGLPIFDLHGTSEHPITITGPDTGARPVLLAHATHNTVRIGNASYVIIRNLELDGRGVAVDGVKAQGVSHHITLENLLIRNHGNDQQTVGISTKAPAWNWVVRRNTIIGAGTGMYLGNSDGSAPFVAGVIEYNLIVDSVGYDLQVKHQLTRPDDIGMPRGPSMTIIRHNVFSKERGASTGFMARPNVLVGHFPLSTVGSADRYVVYGNFFYQNASGECLFQGEGNIALYSNLFVNRFGDGICIRRHNDVPRRIDVFRNTVLAAGVGIKVRDGDPKYRQTVLGNAVFASAPILAQNRFDNITGSIDAAPIYFMRPLAPAGQLNLTPRDAMLTGPPLNRVAVPALPDASRDYDGHDFDARARGAYSANASASKPLRIEMKKPVSTTNRNVPRAKRRDSG